MLVLAGSVGRGLDPIRYMDHSRLVLKAMAALEYCAAQDGSWPRPPLEMAA